MYFRNTTVFIGLLFNFCVPHSFKVADEISDPWPIFNNDSYNYLLGLFVQHKSPLFRHSHNIAEPVIFRTAILLSQVYNITANGKLFAYLVVDTSGHDVIETLDYTCTAITENQILGIVGPEYSNEAKIVSNFANRVGLPVVGYSTTDPELSNRHAYQTFYRFPPSDIITAQALFQLYMKYKWNSTNIIYQSDDFGENGLKTMTEVFNDDIKITCKIKYDLSTNQIDDFERQLKESSSRIVVVWANANVTKKIIDLALEIGDIMSPSFLWILIAQNSTIQIRENHEHIDQLVGVFMLRQAMPNVFSIPTNTTLMHDALVIWKKYHSESYPTIENPLDIYALYAFDAAWFLILAIEKLCEKHPQTCLSPYNHTDSCFASEFILRDELNEIMQTINFLGVSGYVEFQSNTTDRIDSTTAQYVIDNLQASPIEPSALLVIEVLKLNDTTINKHRKNHSHWMEIGPKIRWPNGSLEPPRGYASLKGMKLNITVYRSPPFFMLSNQTDNQQPSGYIHDLVEVLKKQMKFSYQYNIAPIHVRYDELISCVHNHTYDIVMADLAITAARSEKVDFSYPIYDNIMRLVVLKNQQSTISPFAFLKPFSITLWILIIVVFYLISAILIAIFEFFDTIPSIETIQQSNIYDKKFIIALIKSMYYTVGTLLQQGSELQPRTFFGRLQSVNIWITSIILVALLTSNMTTYFTAQREQSRIQSIEDLRMCNKVACDRIGIVEKSQNEEYFFNEIMNGNPTKYYYLKYPHECFEKLLNKHIDVAISDSSNADYLTQTSEYCQLETVGPPFGKTYFGIAFQKNWRYKQDLDSHIMTLKLNGVLDELLAKWFQQKNCMADSNEEENLGILEASGLFYIFAGFTGINVLAFILKRIYKALKHNRVEPCNDLTSDRREKLSKKKKRNRKKPSSISDDTTV